MRSFKLLSISLLSVLGFVFMLASTASATPVCSSVTVTVSNEGVSNPLYSNTIYLTEIEEANGSLEITKDDFSLVLSFDSDIDPFLDYGLVARNNSGGNQTFNFSWNTPVIMTANPTAVLSSLSYSGNDGGDPGVTVSPAGVNGYVQESSLAILGDLGVGLQNFAWTPSSSGMSWGGPGGVSGLSTSAAGPNGPFSDTLEIDVAFTLTPHDMVTMNGRTDIVPTPIPATGVLLLFGLAGIVGIKKKFNLSDN